MPNIRGKFSEALRRECIRLGSIADVCRGTGINRQQFNKYLAGQIMPGVRTLRKICDYIGVTEAQLMSDDGAEPPKHMSARASEIDLVNFPNALAPKLRERWAQRLLSPAGSVLPNGFYDCYFPAHVRPGVLVRWLVELRGSARGQLYKSRTYLKDPAGCGHFASRLKYRGFVYYGAQEACMIVASAEQAHQSAVMSVKTVPAKGCDYYSGLALAHRADGPLAMMAALKFRGPEVPARQALASLGHVCLDEPSLDPVIVRMMRASPTAGSNWMQSVDERSLQTVLEGSSV